jgi:hypothetical protein
MFSAPLLGEFEQIILLAILRLFAQEAGLKMGQKPETQSFLRPSV